MTVSSAVREAVWRANQELARSGLVLGTFGNVSGLDRGTGIFVIKPSGVPYDELTPESLVAISVERGEVVEGLLRPSSDAPTHLELYRAFGCGGIAHTHSECATAFAQARTPVRCLGTTHADHFRGDIPVTRDLARDEVEGDYERNTGLAIVEAFRDASPSAAEIPAVLVASHGPFTWGRDAHEAVEHSRILEQLARMDLMARAINPGTTGPERFLVDRHFLRKHGDGAYYGQR
jgi:L-ribulose-5-phosphate 4-epimerase